MTTRHNIGDYVYIISTKGTLSIEYDRINAIYIESEVRYRVGSHLRSESEIFYSPNDILEKFQEAINNLNKEPFLWHNTKQNENTMLPTN